MASQPNTCACLLLLHLRLQQRGLVLELVILRLQVLQLRQLLLQRLQALLQVLLAVPLPRPTGIRHEW